MLGSIKMAQKAHKPTDIQRTMVRDMAFAGFSHERIAKHIPLDADSLKKHYKAELEEKDKALGEVAGRALLLAKTAEPKIAIPLIIFILKTQCGWRETDFADAADKLMDYVINAKSMTLEEWKTKHGKKKPS